MWKAPTRIDKDKIQQIYEHFIFIYSEIPKSKLYDRIYSGYCWGEGGLPIISIEDWEDVFNYTKLGAGVLTCFKSWEDYDKYEGNWHKKPKKYK